MDTRMTWVRRVGAGFAVVALLGGGFAARGMAADEHARHAAEGHEFERWRHGEIQRFHEHDMARWRAGHWFHGEHFGRLGWWWIVDGTWFFYPAVVYPYPDPYVPPTVVTQAPAAPAYWYYCPSAQEYYPYITACPEGWTPVAPQPAP
jgi:hypothetical protein